MITQNRFYSSALMALAWGLTAYASQAKAADISVDDDRVQCRDAQYQSIQAAVDAAKPGDTIKVCPGTYRECLRIGKKLTVRGFKTKGSNQVILKPISVPSYGSLVFEYRDRQGTITGTESLANSAIIGVGADGVNLSNLIVDGGDAQDNLALVGVKYINSSGSIHKLVVKNIGGFLGTGIHVYSRQAQTKVTLTNNVIEPEHRLIQGFESWTGIWADGTTKVLIKDNDITGVTGLGSSYPGKWEPSGIRVTSGANAEIDHNSAVNNYINILVEYGDRVKVRHNTVKGSYWSNIDFSGNNGELMENTSFQSNYGGGISVIGDSNKLNNNNIVNSPAQAIIVQGNNNDTNGNDIDDAMNGIVLYGDSNKANNNSVVNTQAYAIFLSGNNNEANNNDIDEAIVGIGIQPQSINTRVNGNKFHNTATEIQR